MAISEGDYPMEMVDLSRVIYDGMPKIPVLPDVHVQKFLSLEKGHPLNVTELSLPCHAGTHVDAPIHIVPNGKSIEELPLDAFVGPGAVIGVKKKGGEEVTARDLEASGVAVHRGDILMLHTGWALSFGGRGRMDGSEGHKDVRHRLHHCGLANAAAAEGFRLSGAQDAARQ
jgi:kynurenine formamidase